MNEHYEQECETDIIVDDVCYDVTFNRVTKYYRENWGADADGNRGQMQTLIDSDYAENIYVDNVPLTELQLELQTKIKDELNKWLEDNEPEIDSEN